MKIKKLAAAGLAAVLCVSAMSPVNVFAEEEKEKLHLFLTGHQTQIIQDCM